MKNNFKTKKRFGQHILISDGVIEKIVDAIDVKKDDKIIEIGVGTGQLTGKILDKKPEILYGIEIDNTAYPIIEERFKNLPNFELIKSDFFDVNLKQLAEDKKIKLVGNLPYNVSSLILIDSVFNIDVIDSCVFMLQKEVAEKLIAKPKTKMYTFLSVFVQTFFNIDYVMSVPARFFSPPPKVISAVVKMIPEENPPNIDKKKFKNFVSMMFSNRRKMIRKKLPKDVIDKAGIKDSLRVEDLSKEEFLKLFKLMKFD